MPFDFKKEYKEFYLPACVPQIVNVPKANYIAVKGRGDPNETDGSYKAAVGILYAVAYTLKMSRLGDHRIDGYYDYVIPPLEGFWWQDGIAGVDYSDKSAFNWISVLRLPDFIMPKDLEWASRVASDKKGIDCSSAYYLTLDEGLCVQIMHIGSFDDEPRSVAILNNFIKQNGYKTDINNTRLHHEIYLSDARRVPRDKLRTVIRHPIAPVNSTI